MATTAPALKGLAHIGIYTPDIEKSIAFYKTLGFSLDDRAEPHAKLAFMSLGTCLLELIQPAELDRLDGRGEGIIPHIAIECVQIEAFVEQLKAKGLAPADAAVHEVKNILGGIKNLFFHGPSGETLELFEYCK